MNSAAAKLIFPSGIFISRKLSRCTKTRTLFSFSEFAKVCLPWYIPRLYLSFGQLCKQQTLKLHSSALATDVSARPDDRLAARIFSRFSGYLSLRRNYGDSRSQNLILFFEKMTLFCFSWMKNFFSIFSSIFMINKRIQMWIYTM